MVENKIKIHKIQIIALVLVVLIGVLVAVMVYGMQTKHAEDCDTDSTLKSKTNQCVEDESKDCSDEDACKGVESAVSTDDNSTGESKKTSEKSKNKTTTKKATAGSSTKCKTNCSTGTATSSKPKNPKNTGNTGGGDKPDTTTPTPEPETPSPSLASAIVSDAYGAHDATPRGVPGGYSWREGSDADPNNADMNFKNYQAVNVWGQVFAAQGQSINYDVRLQARNPEIRFFNGSSWKRPSFSSGSMEGAFYDGGFQSSRSASGIRSDGSSGYSAPLKDLSNGSLNIDAFHWWWEDMYPRIIIPSDTQGILAYMDMRLVPADGHSTVNNRSFIANTGVDFFATPNTVVDPQGWNDGLSQSRMKWVTGNWQRFYITSMTKAQIEAHASKL